MYPNQMTILQGGIYLIVVTESKMKFYKNIQDIFDGQKDLNEI